MVKFEEIISGSLEWTTTVLFRPFSPKKWLILAFVAFLAGAMANGHLNLNFRDNDYQSQKAHAEDIHSQKSFELASIKAVTPSKHNIGDFLGQYRPGHRILIFSIIAAIALVLFVLLLWICSRFYFVFLEDIIKNKASIVVPFKNNKELGNSYFRFNVAFLLIVTILIVLIVGFCLLVLSRAGFFSNAPSFNFWKILSICFPFIILLVLLLIALLLIQLIINDFVLIVMFRDKLKIMPAISKVLSIISLNKLNFVIYILIKMGLSICSSIIYTIMFFIAIFGLIFPALISSSMLYFVYKIIPKDIQAVFLLIVVIVAVPIALFLWYCLFCMFLPFAVFLRTFSVKFFGRLDSRYNLFRYVN